MSVFQGDFLGFTLGTTHSSQLNITRVSTSNRYNDDLLPTNKDDVVAVPGGDGQYYLDSAYTQRTFSLDIAYDDLRDEDLRALRQLFGFKGIEPLIFDEFPYKKYMVKVQSTPTFKYICFDNMDVRLYKGEGTIKLIAYYPYALATFSPTVRNKEIGPINNVGDLNAQLKISFDEAHVASLRKMWLEDLKGNTIGELNIEDVVLQNDDKYILFDSSTHLVEGLNENYKKTGNLYNKYITTGDFFEAPVGRTIFKANTQFARMTYTPLYY